jgi:hypothetical protein
VGSGAGKGELRRHMMSSERVKLRIVILHFLSISTPQHHPLFLLLMSLLLRLSYLLTPHSLSSAACLFSSPHYIALRDLSFPLSNRIHTCVSSFSLSPPIPHRSSSPFFYPSSVQIYTLIVYATTTAANTTMTTRKERIFRMWWMLRTGFSDETRV